MPARYCFSPLNDRVLPATVSNHCPSLLYGVLGSEWPGFREEALGAFQAQGQHVSGCELVNAVALVLLESWTARTTVVRSTIL